jgi:hypothetical protein
MCSVSLYRGMCGGRFWAKKRNTEVKLLLCNWLRCSIWCSIEVFAICCSVANTLQSKRLRKEVAAKGPNGTAEGGLVFD